MAVSSEWGERSRVLSAAEFDQTGVSLLETRAADAAASTAAKSSSLGNKSRPAFAPPTVMPTSTLAVEVRCPSVHVVLLPSCDAASLASVFAALESQAGGTQPC